MLICIRKLDLVDKTLEELGTSKEYRRIRNSINWILIIWFITIGVTWTIDSLWCLESYNDVRAIVIPIILHYFMHTNTCMDIKFAFILRFVNT